MSWLTKLLDNATPSRSAWKMPLAKTPQTYTYYHTGPFWIASTPTDVIMHTLTIDAAVDNFVRYGIPPIQGVGQMAMIGDADGVAVAAWAFRTGTDGGRIEWTATQLGVTKLRQHKLIEPSLMADIEMQITVHFNLAEADL